MIKIKNSFHGTEYRTKRSVGEINRILETAPWHRSVKDDKWASRVRVRLCGSEGCECSNDLGARGKQDWEMN